MPYNYNAVVKHVHDGDTFTLDVDLGFGIHSEHNLRLAGVNAPELATSEGKVALAWVQEWFSVNASLGLVTINTHKGSETEKYGRYLARLFAPNGQCLNDDLLAAGHAVPMVY